MSDLDGVAGEPEATTEEAPQVAVTDSPTQVPVPDPTEPVVAILAGGALVSAEAVARAFHETYERLAPSFSYETRKASAVPWEQVPENNRALMTAVAAEVAPLVAAQALRSAYWKLREHASSYRGADAFRRVVERYEASDRDERLYRGVVIDEWYARGIEAAARDVAELLGIEEYDIEGERADELEAGRG